MMRVYASLHRVHQRSKRGEYWGGRDNNNIHIQLKLCFQVLKITRYTDTNMNMIRHDTKQHISDTKTSQEEGSNYLIQQVDF